MSAAPRVNDRYVIGISTELRQSLQLRPSESGGPVVINLQDGTIGSCPAEPRSPLPSSL